MRQLARKTATAVELTEILHGPDKVAINRELMRMSRAGKLHSASEFRRMANGEWGVKVRLIPTAERRGPSPWPRVSLWAGVTILGLAMIAGVIILVKTLLEALVAATPLLIVGALLLAAVSAPTVIHVTQSVVIKR